MNGKNAVVAYVPAIHRGYVDFFNAYPGTLYLLGYDFVKEAPRLDRDIRALVPEEAEKLVKALDIFEDVIVLRNDNLGTLAATRGDIVMPDEELMRLFAAEHLKGRQVTFVSVFLRWDRKISTTESEVSPDRVLSRDAFDREILAKAEAEAARSPDWWRQIGAILVHHKTPVLWAHNTAMPSEYALNAFGDPRSNFDAGERQYKNLSKFIHAEAAIIAEAARRGLGTEGASLYVTTFPCPACARSIVTAGIKEVFYAKGYSLMDAEDILRAAGAKVVLVH